VQLWFNPADVSGMQGLIERDASNQNTSGHVGLYLNGDDLVLRIQTTSESKTITVADSVNAGDWHHAAVSFGSNGLELYLNGDLVAEDSGFTTGIDGNNNPWVIGAKAWKTSEGSNDGVEQFFEGQIADVAIFDQQLSSSDIDVLADRGTLNENAADGTYVTTASGTDADAGDTLTYALTDDAGGRFAIDADTGEITVADGSLLDHEVAASHDVTVQVTDAAGATYEETFSIAVNDLNDGLTVTGTSGTDTLTGSDEDDRISGLAGNDEIYGDAGADVLDGGDGYDTLRYDHSSAAVQVDLESGAASGGDAEGDSISNFERVRGSAHDDTLTGDTSANKLYGHGGDDVLSGGDGADDLYAGEGDDRLIGGAGNDELEGSGGTDTAVFSGNWADYTITESGGVYTVQDNVGDDGIDTVVDVETFEFADVTLSAADILNDAPDDLTLDNASVDENVADGTVVGTAAGSDVDVADVLSYSLSDDAGGRFAIDSSTGEITVADGSLLDHEAAASHDVTLQVTDAAGATYDEAFTINVGDVNEAPTDIGFDAEKAVSTTVVSEDFESGATGWSDNTTSTGGAGLDGNYLGNFFGTNGEQTVYKTFALSGDQDSVTINFDFWEFDTWNGEEFKIWVDDELIATDVYYTQEYLGESDVSSFGTATSDTSSNLGEGIYNDQTHNYSFTVDSSATNIKVGFGSNLDESASDNTESWGIDNFEIVENQGGTALPVEQTDFETVATGEIVSVGSNQSVDRWSLSHDGGDLTIDMFANGFNGSDLDSIIHLFRDDGGGSYTLIGSNDDGSAGSDGSTSSYDSYLETSDLAAGDYIIAVGSYGTSSSEAIASGGDDTASATTNGAYQLTINGNATLNGIATDPSDGNPWGDPNGAATITSVSGGGLEAGETLATLEAFDVDSGDAAGYSLNDDAGGRYSINESGELSLDVAHDGSAIANDSITVRTTDSGGLALDETFEVTLGSSGTDSIDGSAGRDIVHGLGGDDTITAGDGDDLIYGGAGDDVIDGEGGSNVIYGGAGDDTIDNNNSSATGDVVYGGDGNDSIWGAGGDASDTLYGDAGNDYINGELGDDVIYGGTGNDSLYGHNDDDTIHGDEGDDLLVGGSGNDTLYGGAGTDTLTGEDGDDLFVLLQGQGNDTVDGGSGGGWTDTIELQDGAGGNNIGDYGSDWTMELDNGSVESADTSTTDGWLNLTDDAAGTITMQDGTEIDFTGIEHIQW